MIDSGAIKQLAKAKKMSVKDLLVLAPQNDPFYAGPPSQIEKAKWFTKVYEDMGSPGECPYSARPLCASCQSKCRKATEQIGTGIES